jgi:hypothetical protein
MEEIKPIDSGEAGPALRGLQDGTARTLARLQPGISTRMVEMAIDAPGCGGIRSMLVWRHG